MLEIGFGDGVQGGFLPLVSSSLFLFMGLQSQISISMLEAKALGQWWKAAWLSRFGITAPFPAAVLPSSGEQQSPRLLPVGNAPKLQLPLQRVWR